jgi:SAM-dependent methyltransferase
VDEASLLAPVGRYYADKIEAHGPTSRGVDWKSAESQALRFDRILEVCDTAGPFSILDYGCGYGALVDHLRARSLAFEYVGFDIVPAMTREARRLHAGQADCRFLDTGAALPPCDYAVASGVFNVKLAAPVEVWQAYVLRGLDTLHDRSRKGFAFNLLTAHSDPERRRDTLYYAAPGFYLEHCLHRFSRRARLLHDYPLFEFTVVVRK